MSLAIIAYIGGHISPPPVILVVRCITAASLILLAKVAVWFGSSHQTFKREERLLVVVSVLAIGGGWYSSREWINERYIDDRVSSDNRELKLRLDELSGRILVFAADHERHQPPAPRPETWDRDEANLLRYRQDTEMAFEASLGPQVRAAHTVLASPSFRLTDRDFERFYRQPADTFEMRVVAKKLAFFSSKIPTDFK